MSVTDENLPRRVTMRDIAEAAQVPVSAVGLVLNGKPGVSQARREVVLKVARQLGYGPAKTPQTRIIGLVIEELGHEARVDGFIDSIVQGVYAGARETGSRVVLGVYHPGSDP